MIRRAMINRVWVLAICSIALSAQAQVQRSGNADARVAQQLQQVTNEKLALQSENKKLQQEVEQLKAQLQKSAKDSKDLETRNRQLQAVASNRDASASRDSEERLQKAREQTNEVVGKYKELAQTLREVETDRNSVKAQLGQSAQGFKVCVDKNLAMYQLNDEILDRMEDRGFWSNVMEREPFTRLQRTKLENLIDDYRNRAEDQRVFPYKLSEQGDSKPRS